MRSSRPCDTKRDFEYNCFVNITDRLEAVWSRTYRTGGNIAGLTSMAAELIPSGFSY